MRARTWTSMLAAALLAGCGSDEPGDMASFAERAAACEPAAFDTQRAAGAAGRYSVEGVVDGPVESSVEDSDDGGCRITFTFTENPNPAFAGERLTYVVDPNGPIEAQLRDGLTECLEGRSGTYLCNGPLFVAAGGMPAGAAAGPLPCGEAVADPGEPLYAMPSGGAWGFMDAAGDWVIEPKWDRVEPFSEGRAAVAQGNTWGIIDRHGDYVLEPQLGSQSYSTVDGARIGSPPLKPFSEGCAAGVGAAADRPPFFVDRDGGIHWRSRPPEAFGELDVREYGAFSEGLAWFRAYAFETGNRYGWVDADGEVVIGAELEHAGDFVDGLAPAESPRGGWAFIDAGGTPTLPGKWTLQRARSFSEGLAFVHLDVLDRVFMDRNGDSFDSVRFADDLGEARIGEGGDFNDGLAAVRTKVFSDRQFVYIEPDGMVALVPDELDGIKVCNARHLPGFRDGLVRLLVADDGADCGDDANGLGLPEYEQAHYVYLDADGEVVLRQPHPVP